MNKKINEIKLLAMDVDGVLTDGAVILGNNLEEEYKSFNEQDAHGVRMLIRAGIIPAIITGRRSKLVANWATEVGIKDVYQKAIVKVDALQKILEEHKLLSENIAYVGDDLIDIGVLKKVGFAVAVNNAVDDVKNSAHYITKKNGGCGAIREVIELILKTQGKWKQVTDRYIL